MDATRAATAAPRPGPWGRHPWLVPAGLLVLLAALTVNVLTDGPLVGTDRWIRRIVQAQATSARWWWVAHGPASPARVLLIVTNQEAAVAVLALAAALLAARRGSLRPLYSAVVGGVLLAGIVFPAKILIGRPHPGHAVLLPGTIGDFPSGNTATVAVCYVLAALLLTVGQPPRRRRIALGVAWGLAVLVGLALIWCDDHWFTDVVAGWAVAGLIVRLTMRLTGPKPGPDRPSPRRPAEERQSPVSR